VATARDVAKRAGVSTSTVSHVLNGTRTVSDDLRARVLAAFEELNYEPNPFARSLKVKRSNTIGLVILDLANPFYTAVARGVEDVVREHGYALIIGNSDEEAAKEADYVRLLRARRVDGLLLMPSGERHEAFIKLVRSQFPLVFVDRVIHGLDVSSVSIDSELAAHQMTEHLIGLGHRRIGIIAGPPWSSGMMERLAGYRRAILEHGLPIDEALVVSGSGTSPADLAVLSAAGRGESGRIATEQMLALDEPPTALFATNNQLAVGAFAVLRRLGIRIPEDIALVGFDDFQWGDLVTPRITRVAQPTYEMGRTAAMTLIARIENPTAPSRRVILGAQLLIRESSGGPIGPVTTETQETLESVATRENLENLDSADDPGGVAIGDGAGRAATDLPRGLAASARP
jgi:DNA-binding LacI/PurR family transcriptional regulator